MDDLTEEMQEIFDEDFMKMIRDSRDNSSDKKDNRKDIHDSDENNSDENSSPEKEKKFQERRETFEHKVGFGKYESDMDSAQEKFQEALAPIIESFRDKILDFVARKDPVGNNDPKILESMVLNAGELKKMIVAWLVKIHLDSKLKALEEIRDGGVEVEITRNFESVMNPVLEPWEPLPPQEAVDFFNRKVKARITDRDGKRSLMELGSKKELPYYDEKAFAVTGIVRDDILNNAKQIILTGIRNQDRVKTIENLKDMFNKYLEQGIAVDDELLAPHRLQTIVRTNMTEAVNNGRRAMYEHEDVGDYVQYWIFSAVLDSRVTDYCRCMDGKIFRIERLAELDPPAHYNSLVGGSKILTREGIKNIEDIKPDDFVLTHRNRWRRVYATMSKKNDLGSFKQIEIYSGRTLRITDEHPILTDKGWKFVSDLEIGDKVFQNVKKLDGIPNHMAAHPEYFPSLFDQPAISFDVVNFTRRSLMRFPIDFHSDLKIWESEIDDIDTNNELKFERNSAGREESKHNRLVEGGSVSKRHGKRSAHFLNGGLIPHGVLSFHSNGMSAVDRRFFFPQSPGPMVFTGGSDIRRVCNRCLKPFASDSDTMLFAPIGKNRFSDSERPLNSPDGFATSPVFVENKGFNKDFIFESVINSHRSSWITSAIISTIDMKYNEEVYNLGVEEDETYVAEDIIVHNCRSVSVPITETEVLRMKERGEGIEVAQPCPDRAATFSAS